MVLLLIDFIQDFVNEFEDMGEWWRMWLVLSWQWCRGSLVDPPMWLHPPPYIMSLSWVRFCGIMKGSSKAVACTYGVYELLCCGGVLLIG